MELARIRVGKSGKISDYDRLQATKFFFFQDYLRHFPTLARILNSSAASEQMEQPRSGATAVSITITW